MSGKQRQEVSTKRKNIGMPGMQELFFCWGGGGGGEHCGSNGILCFVEKRN